MCVWGGPTGEVSVFEAEASAELKQAATIIPQIDLFQYKKKKKV